MVSEVEEFLAGMLPRQLAAEHALCRGDARPRSGTWSQRDPVTLFGAAVQVRRGWDELSSTFRWLAYRFSDRCDYEFELVAAGVSGDLASTVGFEHTRPSSPTASPRPTRSGSPTSTGARTASGGSFTGTATTSATTPAPPGAPAGAVMCRILPRPFPRGGEHRDRARSEHPD
jgi:hypothetical protein